MAARRHGLLLHYQKRDPLLVAFSSASQATTNYYLCGGKQQRRREGKYASSKQLCTTKSSTTTPSATTVTTGTTVMSLVFMAVHFRFKMVSVSASSSICLDTFVEEILKRTEEEVFHPSAVAVPPACFVRCFLKKEKFSPSSLHPRH